MKILIIVPRFINKFNEHYEFPLGLAYISSYLKHNNFNVNVLNLNHYS